MAFVTVGNLKRFLEKLKTYISNNYISTHGGTDVEELVLGVKDIAPPKIETSGNSPRIEYAWRGTNLGGIGKIAGSEDAVNFKTNGDATIILDGQNCTTYVPKKDGTGATGTWPINITGNATNDSDGNKIVDTYAKKTDIPTNSITVDDELDVLSENPVQNKVVSWALEDKLGNGGWKYSKKKTYDSAGYYANNVLQRAGVEQYPFLEVQFRDEGGPKVSISSNDVTVYGSKGHQDDESTKVMLDGYGLTYSYGKHNAKLILDETVNGGIRLLTDSDSLTIPSSNFVDYEKKLKFNSANIATEDYVKSAIAAIASYDDTAF